MNRISLFIILIPLMLSCQGLSLSKEESMSIISEYIKNEGCFCQISGNTFAHSNTFDEDMVNIRTVVDAGLATLDSKQVVWGWNGYTIQYFLRMTDSTMNYFYKKKPNSGYPINTYKITTLKVKEILGIALNEENKTAKVRYSVINERTPFYNIKKCKDKCELGSIESELEFQYYDTGWKLKL